MSSFTRTWIPNQHGAWAFLITPVIVGALAGGPNAWHLLLLGIWLSAYCLNFFVSLAVKSRRPQRYRQQLALYGAVTVVCGLPLAWHDPSILRLLVLALPAFAVNVWHVLQRNERAWLNDMVGIALAGIIGYGAFDLGSSPDARATHAALALVAVCAYFAGTVLYVKTMIRERGSVAWLRLSYVYHALLVIIAVLGHAWVIAALAALLLVRAILVPRLQWAPKRVGLTELAATIAVALAALLTLP